MSLYSEWYQNIKSKNEDRCILLERCKLLVSNTGFTRVLYNSYMWMPGCSWVSSLSSGRTAENDCLKIWQVLICVHCIATDFISVKVADRIIWVLVRQCKPWDTCALTFCYHKCLCSANTLVVHYVIQEFVLELNVL